MDTYTFEGLPNPKSAYTCQVAVGLACPDDKTYLDPEDYGSGTFDNSLFM